MIIGCLVMCMNFSNGWVCLLLCFLVICKGVIFVKLVGVVWCL